MTKKHEETQEKMFTQEQVNEIVRKRLSKSKELAVDFTERENNILEKEKSITERENLLVEKESSISERENLLIEKESSISERENLLIEKENSISERENILIEKQRHDTLKEYLMEKDYPIELLDILDSSNEENFKKTADEISTLFAYEELPLASHDHNFKVKNVFPDTNHEPKGYWPTDPRGKEE